jgi:hypothetical protein
MECPRRGFAILVERDHEHVVQTVCKTWGCKPCAEKLVTMYQLRTEYGSSRVEQLSFTTVTYEMGKRSAVTARSAGADLRRLWQRMRYNKGWSRFAWCRVTELTKKGQVHHHMMIGGVMKTPRCVTSRYSRKAGYQNWYNAKCKSEEVCQNHEMAREWKRITGDSNVIDVDRVRSVRALSDYLSKYLSKGLKNWEALAQLGFSRRWNCSRNWPSPGRLRMAGSAIPASMYNKAKESDWAGVHIYKFDDKVAKRKGLKRLTRGALEENPHCDLIKRVGIDLNANSKRRAKLAKIGAVLRGN